MKGFFALLIAISMIGCTSHSSDQITGKWLMYRVIQNGQDVTEEHDPYHERYLILKGNGSFESGGRPFGQNSGKYSIDEDYKLFLDSDAGSEDDSYWNVRIKQDTMYWQGYGSEWAENFQIIQIRALE